ncbi:MAG: hypothetical protein OXG71_05805 [Rhodospirillales bacterium]|nr:hypothetical protein [Rhodospirillales bacterium]
MPSQKLWDDQAVTLSYTPGANPIQDTTGNDAPTLIDLAVIVDEGSLPGRPPGEQPPSGRRPVADAGGLEQVAGTGGVQVVGLGASVTLDGSGSSDPDGDSLTFAWAQRPLHGEIIGPGGKVLDKGGRVFLSGAHTARATFVAPMQPGILYFELTVSDPSGRADGDSVLVEVRDLEASDAPDFGAELVAAITLISGEAMEPLVLPEATGGNGELTYALTSRSKPANPALTPVVSASPPPGLSFDPAKRTLSGTPTAKGTWSVSYTAVDADDDTRDSDMALQIFTIEVQDDPLAPPAATGVAVVSGPGDDATYGLGDTIRLAVTFSEPVEVDTTGGTPSLAIDMDPAEWGEKRAAYESGTGTDTLIFVHEVVEPNLSTEGIAVLADSLTLNGGTIHAATTGADAALGHAGLDHDPDHKVDWRQAATPALTASFHDVPASHGGEDSAFSFGLVFSEALARQLSSATLRNEALSATNATVIRTKRVVKGDNRRWTVTVRPDSGAEVTVSLPATTDCAAAGALCTPDGRRLSNAVTATVSTAVTATESPAAPSVTGVSVVSSPTSGSTYMLGETIRIRATFDQAVTVTGSPRLSIDMDPAAWGTKQAAYASGSGTTALDFVHTVVEPNYSTQGIAVLANSLALNGGTIRSAGGTDAALAHTGLGHASGHKVDWRPSISVADARADEGAGAVVAFEVSLSRAFTTAGHSVTVDYATADGTATAGEDYTATSGTLTFAAGESSKTVNVPILDDSHDEGNETFVLRLSNATGARIADGEATGTIANEDPLQTMWLSRFGRTVASDAVVTVTARLQTPRDAGSHLTLAGQRVPLDGSGDGRALAGALPGFAQAFDAPPLPVHADDPFAGHGLTGAWTAPLASAPARRVTGRELLLGTSFRAVLASDAGTQLTSWGQGASLSRFSGAVPGLSLSGETASGTLGMDYERGRLLTGFAMMHSVGEGTAHDEGLRYAMGSTVTTLLPYARYAFTERLSAWGLAGTGSGSLALGLDTGVSPRQRTDLSLTLAATGVRGELLTPAEAGGFALALKADAFWVRTESDAVSAPGVGNLAAARGESSRVRAVLDGSRTFAFPGGATLTPSVELGVRHDGGDAETGTGVELGAGLGYADPSRGLDMALRVHGLSAHAGDEYSEWGVSGSLRLVPGDAGRGLSASLTPSYGADPGGSQRLWMLPDADAMAANDDVPLSSRLGAEVGYGMAVFGGRFTGTPHVGFGLSEAGRDWRVGWRLSSGAGPLKLSLEAIRREPDNSTRAGYGAGTEPEHMVGVQVGTRF